jgi:hypothetical protein
MSRFQCIEVKREQEGRWGPERGAESMGALVLLVTCILSFSLSFLGSKMRIKIILPV